MILRGGYRLLALALMLILSLGRCAGEAAWTAEPAPERTFLPLVLSGTPAPTPALPPRYARWQVQYTGTLDLTPAVDLFNLDLFDTPAETIAALHERGVFVMCYFSAGSWEEWRPDAGRFPPEVLGAEMASWPGERWLDVRRLDLLQPLLAARLDLARAKGCDGVDPDNVNGYQQATGFPITAEAQLAYNRWLAEAAHARGLSVGLKNDLEQIPDLLPWFDWALNESCFTYDECELLLPFVEAGKPVFVIEYNQAPEVFCPQALAWGFNALYKHLNLDAYRVDCRAPVQAPACSRRRAPTCSTYSRD